MTRPRDIADSINRIDSSAADETAITINSSENVGIGTATITSGEGWTPKVKVSSASSPAILVENTSSGNQQVSIGASGGGYINASGHSTGASNFLAFRTASANNSYSQTERMRISATSPALSIGKTTFGTAGQGYTVVGNTAPQCYFNKSLSGAVNGVLFYHSDTYVGGLNYDNTSTSLATSSDERLKDNIENSDDAGAKIDAMQVRQFDWKSTGEHQEYGFVAQELEPIFAHAVHTDKEDEYKSVDYACLVPMLVKEIQSLRQRITALENANG